MSRNWGWGVIGLGVVAAGYFFLVPPQAPRISSALNDPVRIAQGEALFRRNCASCHGPEAGGQDLRRPMGGMDTDGTYLAPVLDGTGHAWHHAPEVLFQIVRDGSIAPDSPMKGWKGRMNDEEIVSVMVYFQSLWPPGLEEAYWRIQGD